MVPRSLLGCKRHWFALPKRIRDDLKRHYRPGQEDDSKKPAQEYSWALQEALGWAWSNRQFD
jgi:hypothetical protein